jgi:hypothetical protein
MIFSRPSSLAVAFGVMLSLLAVPSAGHAGLFDCFRPAATPVAPPTTYLPTTVQRVSWMPTVGNAAACNPCAPQVTVAAETRRRWTYSRIPTTTYKPVTTTDPCTGCSVTSYRPETRYSFLPWPRRESYTVYSPVAMPVASYSSPATNTCNPCGSVVSSNYISAGSSGCSTCATGTSVSGTIISAGSSIGSSAGSSVRVQSDSYYPEKTFKENQGSSDQNGGNLKPQLDNTIPNTTSPKPTSTKLPEPSPRGRTAARPIQPITEVRTASWELEAAPASPSRPTSRPKLDFSGWQAASD